MGIDKIQDILLIVKKKLPVDIGQDWCKGSVTYFDGLKDEILEVEAELNSGNQVYLEDELGDILWDYLSLLNMLDYECKIEFDRVFDRCHKKYSERVDAILKSDLKKGTWNEIKEKQKRELREEQKFLDSNN